MTVHAYLRVSTDEQSNEQQESEIKKRFPDILNENIAREKESALKYRPVFESLVHSLQKGDHLVVIAIDRLGRNTIELLTLLEDFEKKGINFISLREGVDFSTPSGRMFFTIMAAMARMERDLISTRTKAALAVLKAKGVKLGVPPYDASKIKPEIALFRDKYGYSYAKIGRMYHHRKTNIAKWYKEYKESFDENPVETVAKRKKKA